MQNIESDCSPLSIEEMVGYKRRKCLICETSHISSYLRERERETEYFKWVLKGWASLGESLGRALYKHLVYNSCIMEFLPIFSCVTLCHMCDFPPRAGETQVSTHQGVWTRGVGSFGSRLTWSFWGRKLPKCRTFMSKQVPTSLDLWELVLEQCLYMATKDNDPVKVKKPSSKDVIVAIISLESKLVKLKELAFNRLAMINEALSKEGWNSDDAVPWTLSVYPKKSWRTQQKDGQPWGEWELLSRGWRDDIQFHQRALEARVQSLDLELALCKKAIMGLDRETPKKKKKVHAPEPKVYDGAQDARDIENFI